MGKNLVSLTEKNVMKKGNPSGVYNDTEEFN
jgi:hypothetical protein